MTDRAPFFYNNGSFWFNETETTTPQSTLNDNFIETTIAELNDTFLTTTPVVISDPVTDESTQNIENTSIGRIFLYFW